MKKHVICEMLTFWNDFVVSVCPPPLTKTCTGLADAFCRPAQNDKTLAVIVLIS